VEVELDDHYDYYYGSPPNILKQIVLMQQMT